MRKIFFGVLLGFLVLGCLTPFATLSRGEKTPTAEPGLPMDNHDIFIPFVSRGKASAIPPSPPPGPTPTPFPPDGTEGWPMVAANPERTSWTSDEVSGNLRVEWYRPIEAYIPQNVQIITSNGLLYISTANGLLALNAANGDLVWRYNTELPLGNSPTVVNEVLYVGGYDRKIHAINALNGVHLWSFEGAKAGFDTNPLVVDGKVIAGSRDGMMYAIHAHGLPNQGRLAWSFKAGGPIHLSAAYKSGVIYFAADDNYAYALNASNGSLIWKSQKLPGDGYHSFWPVIYGDKVIFSAAPAYRSDLNPGTRTIKDDAGTPFSEVRTMERYDIFYGEPQGALIGPTVADQPWANGYPVIDASRLTQYFENNPNPDPHRYKPWRRTSIVLNASNGSEYTFDSDGDGFQEYIPVAYWGTNSGNRYPPLVGPDGTLYQNNLYNNTGDSQGRVMGWKMGTQYLSVLVGQGAVAEPQAISAGGNFIYRSLCCDRVGDYFSFQKGRAPSQTLWSYNLGTLAPGYDEMWITLPGWPRLHGWYQGVLDTVNSAYHNHGDQSPIIPYNGRLYVHRSNALIAFGPGPTLGKLATIPIQNVQDNLPTPSLNDLRARLEEEILKILDAGHLRPGYYSNGQFSLYRELTDYFDNPGDTLYTLARAYPHLSPQLQERTRNYLRREFQDYFDPVLYASLGWADGSAREAMPLPPDAQAGVPALGKSEFKGGWSWRYPQHNFYAMWKYAQIFPADAARVYELAKSKLQVPVPNLPVEDYFLQRPFELNAYITGYIGFLNLQELAGKAAQDSGVRTNVTNELNRLKELRVSTFTKNSYWGTENFNYKKHLDIARNFMLIVPELGDYLNQNILAQVNTAIAEYEYIAPYWFVSRYEAVIGEGAMSNLYNNNALLMAKSYILKESRQELAKYLDAPGFARGDLFYIQNLVIAIEAP